MKIECFALQRWKCPKMDARSDTLRENAADAPHRGTSGIAKAVENGKPAAKWIEGGNDSETTWCRAINSVDQ